MGLPAGPGGVVMAGRPNPSPTPASECRGDGDLMFRHTFLCRLPEPSDREAIMRMGKGWGRCMREMGSWGAPDARMIASMAAALADDVDALAAYALKMERVGSESEVPPGEVTLCSAAPRWAGKLTRLAVEIRSAVATVRSGS